MPLDYSTLQSFSDINCTSQALTSHEIPSTTYPTSPQALLPLPGTPTTLHSDPETSHLKTNLCPHCKGYKYGFTAYFHNRRIFPEPPHHLLRLIEKSYILRDRLKSFLVTYAMRDTEQDLTRRIEDEINAWQYEVVLLVKDIICFADFELDFTPLEKAKLWTFGQAHQLKEHIWGRTKLEMPKGSLQVLLSEYRKIWEGVWVGYLQDQRVALMNASN